ncbi:hypothetical protein ID866_10380 [Astraeus odoratus]|nr:hypothetical protein ID866_10380 [Astraeus odoratus]
MEHDSIPLLGPEPLKAWEQWAKEDWELVLKASLDPNSDDDQATDDLQRKAKIDHVNKRAAERRQRSEEEEQRIWVEAEQKVHKEAEQKKKEEEEAWRAEEARKEAEEAEKAAEAWRRAADRQHKLSMVIPAGGLMCRSTSGLFSGTRAPCDRCASQRPPLKCKPGVAKGKSTACELCHRAKASCSWLKTAGGVTQKQRRMEAKEDDGEDDYNEGNETEGEGDFTVLPALAQEHQDALGALTMTLSALLKEFKGYCHEQWDLQARQVRGLKALQKEMKKANTLKEKELKVTTKSKEKAAEVLEESLESGEEEGEVEDGNKGGVAKGEGSNGDGDVEMGVAPLASST